MILDLNENHNNTFREIDNQDFFEHFHNYFEIKFEKETISSSSLKTQSIARNLKKEFDFHFNDSLNLGAKTDPMPKNQRTKDNKGFLHNFFCFCFSCQTKKYVQRRRSNSIKFFIPSAVSWFTF